MGLTLMREEISKFVREYPATDSSKTATDKDKNGGDGAPPASLFALVEQSQPSGGANGNSSSSNDKNDGTIETITEWRGLTDEVLGNAQSAVDVLNDFLNYDKISTGTLKLELSVLKIGFLIEHAKTEFKLPAAKKKINVVVRHDQLNTSSFLEQNGRIIGDEVRLIQVLRNLVSNALKFTPQGGTFFSLVARVRRRETYGGVRLPFAVVENVELKLFCLFVFIRVGRKRGHRTMLDG